ncbi:MAG: dTDP-4-dehydrorhamnose reductase, partial [Pyrinomonadaceae bacterium]
MKALVTGAAGMVGQAVAAYFEAQGATVFAHDHRSLDITDAAALAACFERERPEVVVNCAAWTDVDGCESDHARAFEANAHAPERLAQNARRIGASLITISTDYVFDGTKEGFYTQRDDPNPTSVYAASKLEGERRAAAAAARVMVVRTGWVFGVGGRNFLSTVIERARRGLHLSAITDAYGTPTYSKDLAARLYELARLDLPGLYHVVGGGQGTSFEEFAREALRAARCEGCAVEGVSMDSLTRPAPRPRNSRLRCLVSEAIGLAPLRSWQAALADFAA